MDKLAKLDEEKGGLHNIAIFSDGSGRIRQGKNTLAWFGPTATHKTPEDALRSLLKPEPEPTAPLPSEQLAVGNSLDGVIEIDGRRFTARLWPKSEVEED